MKGWIYVHTAEDYAKWAAENLSAAAAPAAPADEKKEEGKPKS